MADQHGTADDRLDRMLELAREEDARVEQEENALVHRILDRGLRELKR